MITTNQKGETMKSASKIFLAAGLALLLSLQVIGGAGRNAFAQDEELSKVRRELLESIQSDSVDQQAAELILRVARAIGSGQNILRKLGEASAEDRLVLDLQLSTLQKRLVADINDMADLLVELENGGPQDQLRAAVEDTFVFATPRIWSYISRVRSEIDALRARRPEMEAADRPDLEDRIFKLTARLDEAYEFSWRHIGQMEKLGLDASAARAAYSGLLADRSDELSGRIDLALERIEVLSARSTETPDNADLLVLLVSARKSLDTNTASMEGMLDLMDALELPSTGYRAQLITVKQDLASGLLDLEVAVSLLGSASERLTSWLAERGPGLATQLLLFFGILLFFSFLARLARRLIAKALNTSKLNVSELLRRMILKVAANVVFVLGLLIALSQLGISLGPLLAGFGVAGFILGFALQETLGNFAAGLMILIYRPFDVGDMVEVGGVFGRVDEMSLVSTTILTIDNQTIIIPNNKIWGDVIKNVTAQDIRRVDMVFGISYTDDIPKAEGVLEDILKQYDKILDNPEPVVRLHTLNDSSVDFVVRPWVAVDDYWDVHWHVTRSVKMRFDEENISIPFPQRDVHVYQQQVAQNQQADGDSA